MKLFGFISSLFIASQLPQTVSSIDTVEINPSFYQGMWYQTYGDNFILNTFEKDAYCAYADYTILDDNTIGVYNWERYGSVTGPVQDITGYAVLTENPGQLMVYFSGNVPAPYWVVKIGPVIEDEYQYAVVSDPYELGLYVLARNVTQYYDLYDDEVLEFLDENSFTSLYNKPIQIVHDGCDYSN